ncbi:hypothetical protein H6G97_39895 [Nostoc flagelliforme FACHB-838]|uniref:Transposase n=1 Tax=Nostoc flagelliforme FACHB-838 TaxID=2692904 RepID=A0ABR8E1G3_9NOSO|nr:hypothetical protein [Nostoc flagelliforme]MBD2535248.1 hypothetical protein [Nostoc flagelliforme FACHB-838]
MTNREHPKSTVLECMGSNVTLSATSCRRNVYVWQLYAVVLEKFRNIWAKVRVWQLENWLHLNKGYRNIAFLESTDITFRLDTFLSKGFRGENR